MAAPQRVAKPRTGPSKAGAGHRLAQLLAGGVLGLVSAFVLVGTHRVHGEIAGIDLPLGLIFGFAYQLVASIFLVLAFGTKLPLGALAAVFAALALLFAGPSQGGGILMPAQIGGVTQWQGWAVQFIGVLVPLVIAAVVWAQQIRDIARNAR